MKYFIGCVKAKFVALSRQTSKIEISLTIQKLYGFELVNSSHI